MTLRNKYTSQSTAEQSLSQGLLCAMWSHDLLNHSFLGIYKNLRVPWGMKFEHLKVLTASTDKASSKCALRSYISHTHTHHHFIRNTAKLPSCDAAKVSSKRLKNTTNWTIVYMAWENCSTFFFDWCDHLFWHHIKTESYSSVLHSHCRFQRCSDSNLATFWNLGLEIFSNKSVDFFPDLTNRKISVF